MVTGARQRAILSILLAGVAGMVLLAGCSASSSPAGAAAGGLRVEDAFAWPSPAGGAGGAFLTVVNTGSDADRLVAAHTAIAATTELHETINDNGVMKMRPVGGGFEVPAKGRLELKPGGKHVMFIDLMLPLTTGKEVEFTLTFEKAGDIPVRAPVRR